MDCWTILGLTPTGDERAVLRAYAKKLRETRPEDDPEGFQRLLAAREQALAWRERVPPPPPPPPEAFEDDEGETGEPTEAADLGRRRFRVVMGAEMSAPPKDEPHSGGFRNPDWRTHRPTPVLPPPEPRACSGAFRSRIRVPTTSSRWAPPFRPASRLATSR